MTITKSLGACLWLACAIGCANESLAAPAQGSDERAINAVFPFITCIRVETEKQLANAVRPSQGSPVSEFEVKVWAAVADVCGKQLTDEAKGLMLLRAGGDTRKAIGFYDGVATAARSMVVSRVIEWQSDHN
ncbi:hypothetical protein [Ralstonia chuxiongensis]|uniref:Uncharacterized protein n=1 Tax=Ralstonia chuxiongensis TaxID=2957504 RepID=A0AA41WVZ1_9RALS|nr:hypothetical protein [Ralstonia chuxiongensis]MCP1175626.1 hypothetical protein [Ralstonia chuxiongensis]